MGSPGSGTMESGWMNGSCCKRAATLDYSSDAKPAQPSKRPRPAAAFDARDRGAAWVGDMKGAPNGRNTTANWETNELAAGEIRLILDSPDKARVVIPRARHLQNTWLFRRHGRGVGFRFPSTRPTRLMPYAHRRLTARFGA